MKILAIFTRAFWRNLFKRGIPEEQKSVPQEPLPIQPKEPEPSQLPKDAEQKQQVEKPIAKDELQPSLKGSEPTPEPEPKIESHKKADSLVVRSELNLEHNTIFTVSTYRKKSREIVIREKLPSGEESERRVVIGKTAQGIEVGVLDVHHFKIYLVLLELWEEAGRPIHDPVRFTILKIIDRLGLNFDGKTYRRVKQWLRDLRQVPITFLNSFYIPKMEKHTDLAEVTILNHLRVYERKKMEQKKIYGYGEFQFDRYILENLVNNYTHPLRLDVVKKFKKHKDLAILLYTYLDRCLAFRFEYEIRLSVLFDHLDLSQHYVRKPSDRKIKLNLALKELEGKELSTGILSYCRIHKTEDGNDYKLVARKTPFPRLPEAEPTTQAQLATAEPDRSDIVAQLTAHGLTEEQARQLLGMVKEEEIRRQLEIFPFKLQWYRTRGVQVKNFPALLYMMIKGQWDPPPNYREAKAKEEREREARHYTIWHCRRMDCENFRRMISTPIEQKISRCPLCGSPIEIVDSDYKEYSKSKISPSGN